MYYRKVHILFARVCSYLYFNEDLE